MGSIPTGSPLRYDTGSPDFQRSVSARISQSTPIVFVLYGDNAVCESVALLASSEGWRLEICKSAEDFFGRPLEHVPSCLTLQDSLPGHCGLDLQRRVAAERAHIPIIFLGEEGDVATAVKAMKAGAIDFFTTPFTNESLLSAIRNAIERSRVKLENEAEVRKLRAHYSALTTRERQVMALVVSGMLNKQVGDELGISEITVKFHRGNLMRKMKADSLAELVSMATRLRIKSLYCEHPGSPLALRADCRPAISYLGDQRRIAANACPKSDSSIALISGLSKRLTA